MPASLTGHQKIKVGFLAFTVLAVTTAGTLTGATFKEDLQARERKQKSRALSPSEQISILEDQRLRLVKQRDAMQEKIDSFRQRVRERESNFTSHGPLPTPPPTKQP
ncbi:hypothetical protein CDD82_2233 [Ophiocordyceps australis]|uniref:Uncharacterized protein n=1 Tax=Ophiocordyceps australis TaxID=1399860 RepID=A0A2C5ZCR2_9HYPO|nr:hypothetical protein CDD82_2233 [Ophiocordyceps australis]